jgi:hypothetical protein
MDFAGLYDTSSIQTAHENAKSYTGIPKDTFGFPLESYVLQLHKVCGFAGCRKQFNISLFTDLTH